MARVTFSGPEDHCRKNNKRNDELYLKEDKIIINK